MTLQELRHALKATKDLLVIVNDTLDNCKSDSERIVLLMDREELFMQLDFICDDLAELGDIIWALKVGQ